MIQRNLFLVVVLLHSGVMAHAMDEEARKVMNIQISLPERAEIKKSLRDAGFGDFVFRTKIHRYFNELTASLAKIINVVDQCIREYDRPPLAWITESERVKIVECILSRAPEVYQRWLILERTQCATSTLHEPNQMLFVFEKSTYAMQAKL